MWSPPANSYRCVGDRLLVTSPASASVTPPRCPKALTSLAFGIDEIEPVEIHRDKANVASAGVPRRLGFELLTETPDEISAPGRLASTARGSSETMCGRSERTRQKGELDARAFALLGGVTSRPRRARRRVAAAMVDLRRGPGIRCHRASRPSSPNRRAARGVPRLPPHRASALTTKLVKVFSAQPHSSDAPGRHRALRSRHGPPLALIDGTRVTAKRTAGSALATGVLARQVATVVSVIGIAGVQARRPTLTHFRANPQREADSGWAAAERGRRRALGRPTEAATTGIARSSFFDRGCDSHRRHPVCDHKRRPARRAAAKMVGRGNARRLREFHRDGRRRGRREATRWH